MRNTSGWLIAMNDVLSAEMVFWSVILAENECCSLQLVAFLFNLLLIKVLARRSVTFEVVVLLFSEDVGSLMQILLVTAGSCCSTPHIW